MTSCPDCERISQDRDRWCDLAASRAKQNAELQAELDKALLAAEETAGGAVKLAKAWSREIADLKQRVGEAKGLLLEAVRTNGSCTYYDDWKDAVKEATA